MVKNKGHEVVAHFDIKLVNSGSCTMPISGRDTVADHAVRQKVYHPLPSTGYAPVAGVVPEMPFRRGLSVTSVDMMIPDTMPYSFSSSLSPLLFAYCLEGRRHLRVKGHGGENLTRAGHWYIGYIPDSQGEGVMIGTPRFRGVTLRFDPLALFDLLEGKVKGLPDRLAELLVRLESGLIMLDGKMSRPLTEAVAQLALCNDGTTFNRLVFESRLIDVLMLHLQEIGGCTANAGASGLSDREKRLAEQARALILESLAVPPSLDRIADSLDVAPFVVKTVFGKAFGASVHSFAQDQRMESARRLLGSGDYQVAEVAEVMGYKNTSWFIDVFNRQFGLKPGEYLRQTKQLHYVSTPWAKTSADQ